MKNRTLSFIALISATVFYGLFHEAGSGLNYSLFAILVLGVVRWLKRGEQAGVFFQFLSGAVVLLAFSYAWHAGGWTAFMLGLVLFLLAGSAAIPRMESPYLTFAQSAASVFAAQIAFLRNITTGKSRSSAGWRAIAIYILPILLLLIFLMLYQAGNPVFGRFVQRLGDMLGNLFDILSLGGILTFLAGLFICNLFISATPVKEVASMWLANRPWLQRIRQIRSGRLQGLHQSLLQEFKAGVFLMAGLNILLLLMNLSDLQVVWFGFKWDGQLLRGFVHEGTWLLVISVLLAGGITLFLFRGNLNFISENRRLRGLVSVWIVQNLFLLLSVGMRNWRYIDHYGLAYRRIGVVFFLLALAGMLVFVWLKVNHRHSMQRWVNRSLAWSLSVCMLSALPDWSSIIARYNLSHYQKSFVHMEFLGAMPDHVLPVLNTYRNRLGEIRVTQSRLGYKYSDTLGDKPFTVLLDERIAAFGKAEKQRGWREWVWARQHALKELQAVQR